MTNAVFRYEGTQASPTQTIRNVTCSPRWNSLEGALKQKPSDPVINEIREVRHRISARFGHDPAQLVAFYMEMQKQYQDRLIETAKRAEDRTNPQPDTALGSHSTGECE